MIQKLLLQSVSYKLTTCESVKEQKEAVAQMTLCARLQQNLLNFLDLSQNFLMFSISIL